MDKKTAERLIEIERGNAMGNRVKRYFELGTAVLIVFPLALSIAPRISQAHNERRIGELVDALQRVRSQIAVYQAEHPGLLPGVQAGGAVEFDSLPRALTLRDGRGPDVLQIPANPFILDEENARSVYCVKDPQALPSGNEGTGWWYNAASGRFAACDCPYHTAY